MKIMKKLAAVVMFGLLSVNVASANTIVELPGDLKVLQTPFDKCIDRQVMIGFSLYELLRQNPNAKVTAEDDEKAPGVIKDSAEKACISIYSKVVKGEKIDRAFIYRLNHVENYINITMGEEVEPMFIRAYFAEVQGSYELVIKYSNAMIAIEEEK